jgi:hypothetical protein
MSRKPQLARDKVVSVFGRLNGCNVARVTTMLSGLSLRFTVDGVEMYMCSVSGFSVAMRSAVMNSRSSPGCAFGRLTRRLLVSEIHSRHTHKKTKKNQPPCHLVDAKVNGWQLEADRGLSFVEELEKHLLQVPSGKLRQISKETVNQIG